MTKASTRSLIGELEQDIEQALAARREREKAQLSAPTPAKNNLDRRLARVQELHEQVSIAVAKHRRNGARKNAATEYLGPTAERVAKAGVDGMSKLAPPIRDGTTMVNTRAHQVGLVGDQQRYKTPFTNDMETIARDIVHIFLLAETGGRVTGAYDGVPVSGGGARSGGVQDFVREANATAKAIADELGPGVVDDILWFLTGKVVKPDGSAMKLSDSGRRMSPWKPNEEKDAAVGYGGLFRSLQVLARYMAMRRASGWRLPTVAVGDNSREQTLALLGEIKARGQDREQRSADAYTSRVLARFLSRKRRLKWQEPTSEDMQQFRAQVQARQQIRREMAERERKRKDKHDRRGAR